jgi:hypothetical protein
MLVFQQEIGVMVILFGIFHVCVGFILPSLVRLRTMRVNGASRIKYKISSVFLFTKMVLLLIPAKRTTWWHDELFTVTGKC